MIDWRRLARILRRVERDEDLVQDALLRIAASPPTDEHEGAVLVYGLRALRSAKIGALRRAVVRRHVALYHYGALRRAPSPDPDPLTALIQAERYRALLHAIEALPSRQRLVVEACAEGVDGPELRRRLGAPTRGAAYNVLCRARYNLLGALAHR